MQPRGLRGEMPDLLTQLTTLDGQALQLTESLRWAPLTGLAVLLSAWWVKGPVLAVIGACGDLRATTRSVKRWARMPSAAGAAVAAFLLASAANVGLKELFARERPAGSDGDLIAAVPLPESYSFPSGHAMTAFAAGAAIAVVRPGLRWPALGLAAAVALTRPYLGVHFWSDVLVGAGLGALLGLVVGRIVLAVSRRRGSDRGQRAAAPA